MADTGKIAKNLERFAQAVAAHDRENPTHTAYGIGLAHFDMERLGLEEGEEILPGITIHADGGVTGNFRVLCDGEHDEDAQRGRGAGGRGGDRHAGDPGLLAPGPQRRSRLTSGRLSRRDSTASRLPAAHARDHPHQRLDRRARQPVAGRRPQDRARGSRPAPAARPAAMSRCIELPSVAWARSSSPSAPLGVDIAGALGLRHGAGLLDRADELRAQLGVERISPSSLSWALVVQASAFRRTSLDHITSRLGAVGDRVAEPHRNRLARARRRAPASRRRGRDRARPCRRAGTGSCARPPRARGGRPRPGWRRRARCRRLEAPAQHARGGRARSAGAARAPARAATRSSAGSRPDRLGRHDQHVGGVLQARDGARAGDEVAERTLLTRSPRSLISCGGRLARDHASRRAGAPSAPASSPPTPPGPSTAILIGRAHARIDQHAGVHHARAGRAPPSRPAARRRTARVAGGHTRAGGRARRRGGG